MTRHLTPAQASLSRERMLQRLTALPLDHRKSVWAVYRRCRRCAQQGLDEARVASLAAELREAVDAGTPYKSVILGVKLAQSFTRAELQLRGAAGRRDRALTHEGFHLVRLQLRTQLGVRPAESYEFTVFGEEPSSPTAVHRAWSDAGVRNKQGGAGYIVEHPQDGVLIALGHPLPISNALEAELEAAVICMSAMQSAGIHHAVLHIDSQGVLRAFQGRLSIRYALLEARLLQLAHKFGYLRVIQVPRAFNALADELATAAITTP